MKWLSVGLMMALSGCAAQQGVATAVNQQAEVVVQNVAKDRFVVSVESICHTGYDVLLTMATQAPQIAVGVEAFCGKLPVTSTQTTIQAVPPTLFLGPAQVKLGQ